MCMGMYIHVPVSLKLSQSAFWSPMSSSESALHPEVDSSEETSITSSSQRPTNLLLQILAGTIGLD